MAADNYQSQLDNYDKQLADIQAQINKYDPGQRAAWDQGNTMATNEGWTNDPDAYMNYTTLLQKINTINSQKATALQNQNMASQGLNPDGSPIRPTFESMIDPQTGLLKQPYQLQAQPDIKVDQRAVDEIRNRALEKGPSAWAKMMLDKQGVEQTDALDKNRAQSAGAMDQNLSALMMRGGASSGARENLARLANRDQANSAQSVYRQGQLDRSNIGLQDQQQKNQFLQLVPQLDFQNAQVANANRDYSTNVQQKNIAAALADIEAKRNFDMGTYSEQMKKWAAGKQADAQASASHGKK